MCGYSHGIQGKVDITKDFYVLDIFKVIIVFTYLSDYFKVHPITPLHLSIKPHT
jgi:hypothetical protein